MTREPGEKRKLENSPLIAVLTEVRFAPILTIQEFIPTIQDRLRRTGFPGFSSSTVHQFQIGPNGQPSLQAVPRWVFTSKDNSQILSLTAEGISLQTTAYDDFEAFLLLIKDALEVVSGVIEPSYADRIGLRYVDAVPNIGKRLSQYFNETVLSFTAEELGVISLLFSQHIVAKTEVGHLQIRMNQVENVPLLPPDLITPELASVAVPREGVHAILDIDSSDESRSDFVWAVIEQRLWAVHSHASSAFWKSITKEARDAWGEIATEVNA
ncbi:TIGR04255 family protein [Leifsonia shinshuensis]